MANIYNDQHCDLGDLLSRANNDSGATLLIPDLQRPYVWSPRQVIFLVDSLIRGWPFGTLLTWKVGKDDPVRELARPFWKVVDRTGTDGGAQVSPKNPPGSFQMVLDGQQRVQSLLLAMCGDSWGIRMFDSDWHMALTEKRVRRNAHWSQGSLCVDLEALVSGYAKSRRIVALDFGNILIWAVTGGKPAQSEHFKKSGYPEPMPLTHESGAKGRYIRLSRFWDAAPAMEGIEQDQADLLAEDLLKEHEVDPARIVEMARASGALLLTLAKVKKTRVTFLELAEFDEKTERLFPRDAYNDAVVNIFTRLNTAGRTLTREDITFAWLKVGWLPTFTGNRNASQCFETLSERLSAEKLELSTEDLVSGVSYVWSTVHSDGRLLGNNDLLKGEAIRPMAAALSQNWTVLTDSLTTASRAVWARGFLRHQHYQSLNSMFLLWSWQYIADRWLAEHTTMKELEKDAFVKRTAEIRDEFMDRWLLCSQWAGRWAIASAETITGYAKRLSDCAKQVAGTTTAASALNSLRNFLEAEVKALEPDAISGLSSIKVRRREVVRVYYAPLWLWHRLEEDRWKESKIQLRMGKAGSLSLDVDHSVAHALWERKITARLPDGQPDKEEALTLVNQLGNCALLEKNFNISKSDKTLRSFLSEVYEFKENSGLISQWANALAIPLSMLDAETSDVNELAQAILTRDALIRKDLNEFIKGERSRVDLNS